MERDILSLPETIRERLGGRPLTADTIGLSGARVLLCGDLVLKIQPAAAAERELTMLRWLDGRLPAPRLVAHELADGSSYCLMTRVPGRMACDESFLCRSDLPERLAEALRLLWAVDHSDCPLLCSPEEELKRARARVESGLVNVENTEPTTFGPGGFRDPEALLRWLEDNRPDWEPCFTHGDFCLTNVFLTENGIGGYVDMGSAGVGDPWRDVALCRRSLRHNTDGSYGVVIPGFDPDRLFDALGLQPDPEKLRWYLLLDELY